MFGLFENKKVVCESCHRPLEKHHVFDPTPWIKHYFFHFKKMKLCTACMMKKYKEYLDVYEGKSVVIEPMKNYIAFPHYTFAEISDGDYWPKEGVAELKNILDTGGVCADCKKAANFLLCSPEIYQNDPLKPFDINNGSCLKVFLCAKCLCDRLEKIIDEKNIFFDAIHPITDGDGVATSFNP